MPNNLPGEESTSSLFNNLGIVLSVFGARKILVLGLITESSEWHLGYWQKIHLLLFLKDTLLSQFKIQKSWNKNKFSLYFPNVLLYEFVHVEKSEKNTKS